MNAIAVIAEYNPFHNGHFRHLQLLKQTYPQTPIIILMSGAFVQRGEPAIFSKQRRTRWALLCGADLVIELPAIFAVSSASRFAFGGTSLARALRVSHLSFGAETSDTEKLTQTAKALHEAQKHPLLKSWLQKGLVYGTALTKTAASLYPESQKLLSSPNNLLAIEYIRELIAQQSDICPLPVLRTGNHHALALDSAAPSGTALRQHIQNEEPLFSFLSAFPSIIQEEVRQAIAEKEYTDFSRYEDCILFASRTHSLEEFQTIEGFTEGLEYKWTKVQEKPSWAAMRDALKSGRYSYARLNRMGAALALHITKSITAASLASGPLYLRLLGMSSLGRAYLRTLHTELPVITKLTNVRLSSAAQSQLAIDLLASDIQSFCFTDSSHRSGKKDYFLSPIVIS